MGAGAGWKNWLLATVIGATSWPAAWAIEADLPLAQMQHTAWTRREGAPPDAWTMAQTSDGALWLGTTSGLYRFDGMRFEPFTSVDDHKALTNSGHALLPSPDGGLWLGTDDGVIFHVLDGHATAYDVVKQANVRGSIGGLAYDHDGQLWAVSLNGPIVFRDGRWQSYSDWTAGEDQFLTAIHCDRRGTLWLTGRGGGFTLARGAKTFVRHDLPGDYGSFAETPDGAVWYGGAPQLRRFADAAGQVASSVVGLSGDVGIGSTSADRDGGLWFVLEGDLGRIPDARKLGTPTGKGVPAFVERMGAGQGLSGDVAQAVFEDRDGNIWVSTNGGLDRFRRPRFAPVPVPYLYNASLTPDADGRIWALSQNADLALVGKTTRTFKLPNFNGTAAHRDDAGTLWIGSGSQIGRFSPERGFEAIPMPAKGRQSEIRALASDAQGRLWAAPLLNPTYRWTGSAWVQAGGISELAEAGNPDMISRDDLGRMWFVFRHQIARLDGERLIFFHLPEETGLGSIESINVIGDVVWLGCTKGLGLLSNGRWNVIAFANGAATHGVSGIVRANDGDLWLNASAGIYRIPKSEVERAQADPRHPLVGEMFDRFDGLMGVATQSYALPSATRSSDGRLWFSTTRNVVSIDPANIQRNPRAPSVEVRAVNANGVRYEAAAGVHLPIGTTQLDIEYSAPGLSNPEKMAFRYQLEGADSGWRDADGRRQVYYTNLHPGTYRFHVIASNEDGVWNTTGATLSFDILPAFYQTRWFAAVCAALVLLALWGLHRLRLMQVARTLQARVEARAQERERIARELHDTLLQSAQGMVMMISAAVTRLRSGQSADALLDRAASTGQEAVVEARERIRQLRQRFGPPVDIAYELRLQGDALASDPGAARFEFVGGLPDVVHPMAGELLQIGREAIRNAFRHARASVVRTELGLAGAELFLRVLDDGVGIGEQTRARGSVPGHWGLPGMRERAQQIGASLAVERRPEGGTLVELRMPLSTLAEVANPAGAKTA